jgi:sulfate transport system ATP-binding protein
MGLKIETISKAFARFPALNAVSLDVRDGEFLALLGPSGSGKTTLLRVLAGLAQPDAGRVLFDGEDFLAQSARERRVGMVFQHYALFRHMTVEQNIAFGLRVRPRRTRPPRREIRTRVQDLLGLVQLEGLGKRYPAQLSGGQQQRVALARALAVEPKLLLLDEPFGALDAKVRTELRRHLRRIHDATGVTTVFVTHDQEEAMDLADRVAVMSRGQVEQIGSPDELESAPGSAFVFEFLGDCNRLPCVVEDGLAKFDGFTVPILGGTQTGAAEALFRPYETDVSADPEADGVPVRVLGMSRRGASWTIECEDAEGRLLTADTANLPGPIAPAAQLRLKPLRVFVAEPGANQKS